jgi:predicted deacylase
MSTICRFVRPEITRLTISDGDTLTVRKRLTNGERRAMFTRLYHSGVTPGRLNTLDTGLALVVAYLIDWTLTDDSGALVPIRDLEGDDLAAILDGLDPESFGEIKDAIEDHVAAMDLEREKKTATTAGALAS